VFGLSFLITGANMKDDASIILMAFGVLSILVGIISAAIKE